MHLNFGKDTLKLALLDCFGASKKGITHFCLCHVGFREGIATLQAIRSIAFQLRWNCCLSKVMGVV